MKPAALFTAITVLLGGPTLALALLIPLLTAGDNTTTDAGTGCTTQQGTTSGVAGLTQPQLGRAALIHAVAVETGMGAQGAVIGIATAMQESDLGADPATNRPNSDGDIGLFQMRTLIGWHADGATTQDNITTLLNDRYQARVFFLGHTTRGGSHIPGLADIPNWQHLHLAQAAQHVQRSAFPNAYARHEATARAIVATLLQHQPDFSAECGVVDPRLECPTTPAGVGTEQGLSPDAIRVMRCVTARWTQIRTIGGLRPGDPRDHGTGRAVDVMIPYWNAPAGDAIGDAIAEWARTNAARLGVTYVIWQRRIWSVARTKEGWRNCSQGSCYNGPDPTGAHEDHVHISVNGTTGAAPKTVNSSSGGVVLPVAKGSYRITAGFGHTGTRWSTLHTGLDFAAPTGTIIRAVTAGTVTYAQPSGGAYGTLTKIISSGGTEAWYAHQSHINVRVGQTVLAGQVIGAVGATGNVTGPHLHLEIRTHGRPTNPRTWLDIHGLNP